MDFHQVQLVGGTLGRRHDDAFAHVLEKAILQIEAVRNFLSAQDTDGTILDLHVHNGETGVAGKNGRLFLTFEIRVHHGDGPTGRRSAGIDAIAGAEQFNILQFIAHIIQAGITIAAVDSNMAHDTMLRHMGAHTRGSRIPFSDTDVHIGNAAVEGSGTAVRHPFRIGHNATGEPDHRFWCPVKAL